MYHFISLIGVFVLLGLAWLFSPHKKIINWRVIAWGIGLQAIFAMFIFLVPAGAKVFVGVNSAVTKILEAAQAGAEFVFGPLAVPPGEGKRSVGNILAFQAFPTIIFFSALVSILYFIKLIPWIIQGFAYLFTKLMRISGAESLFAASSIFVGVESTFTIKPHLPKMTRSELFTLLTIGMATVASNVLAIYVVFLKDQFPMIAGHLVSASLLSAPAALMTSKLMMPETDKPLTLGEKVEPGYEKDNHLFSAIINGANSGVKLIVGIVALLIAVISLVELVNLFLGWIGGLIAENMDLSLEKILGYIFYPFTFLMGIPPGDAGTVSQIIGERVVVTEVAAYQDLAAAIANGSIQSQRSVIITSYALCGFAHFASMAIFIGGIAALAPGKTSTLAKYGFKALLAATLATMITGCIAGIFAGEQSLLFGGLA